MLLMTPGPTNVSPRVMKAIMRPIINHRGQQFHELYESLEENLKYTFRTRNDVFILSSSGTGGVECAVSNAVFNGDKVLIPINGDFSQRLRQTIKVFGGKPVEIPIKWGETADIKAIREAIEREKNMKAIAVVYNETSTGAVTRCLRDIGKLAEEKSLLLIVDAVSALAGEELPVDEWKVDLCVTCSQKAIAAPPGLAMVSVSKKAWEGLEKTPLKTNYFDLRKFKAFHERMETPYTPAVSLFYALDEALKMLREEGLDNRLARHRICAKAFYEAMETMGLEPLAAQYDRSNTVLAIRNPPKINDKDIRDVMLQKHGIAIAGGMGELRGLTFRIGNMGIISEKEVMTTVNALEETLRSLGMNIKKDVGSNAAAKVFR